MLVAASCATRLPIPSFMSHSLGVMHPMRGVARAWHALRGGPHEQRMQRVEHLRNGDGRHARAVEHTPVAVAAPLITRPERQRIGATRIPEYGWARAVARDRGHAERH